MMCRALDDINIHLHLVESAPKVKTNNICTLDDQEFEIFSVFVEYVALQPWPLSIPKIDEI